MADFFSPVFWEAALDGFLVCANISIWATVWVLNKR
jgi:hypothetical protein